MGSFGQTGWNQNVPCKNTLKLWIHFHASHSLFRQFSFLKWALWLDQLKLNNLTELFLYTYEFPHHPQFLPIAFFCYIQFEPKFNDNRILISRILSLSLYHRISDISSLTIHYPSYTEIDSKYTLVFKYISVYIISVSFGYRIKWFVCFFDKVQYCICREDTVPIF